jgi:hypothetical protein
MYVKWKRYERGFRRYHPPRSRLPETLLVAVLVVSKRVNGKPRQRQLAYLGSIREERLGEARNRGWFWQSVDQATARLDLMPTRRKRLEAALALRVPRPAAKEVDTATKAAAKELAEIKARLGGRR